MKFKARGGIMQQLNIIRGDFYPYLEDSCNIRIIDKTTGQITTEDFSDCYAVLQIQKLQKTYASDVLNTKILPLSLSREETSSLRKCIEDTAYLAIYKNDGSKKKTKTLALKIKIDDPKVTDNE